MWRPRFDIGRLQFRDSKFSFDETSQENNLSPLVGVIIHARTPKEVQVKSIKLRRIKDTEICPVCNLFIFIQQLIYMNNYQLYLAYIDISDKVSSIQPTTLATWLSSMMKEVGIDINIYKPHSLRSASSTKAVQQEHSMDSVKTHTNWSLNSNTFEKYYYKPAANSIFNTEKSITLEVGVESTGTVLGTTNNTTVDETKTENLIHTRPLV